MVHETGLVMVSKREREVWARVAMGLSNAEIASELGIQVQVVKNYVHTLFNKTRLTNRTLLAIRWVLEEESIELAYLKQRVTTLEAQIAETTKER